MKYRALKTTFIFIVSLSILSISYSQEKLEKAKDQVNVVETNYKYYYRNFHCFDFVKQCELAMLKLIKLDTLIYVSSSQAHGNYEEIHGKLKKINDTIFFVQPFKHFIQSGNKDKPYQVVKDSVFFYCDSSLINSTLTIEYLNGKKEQYKIYSTENSFWINEKYFNNENKRIYLSFDYKNPLVDETVEIVSLYNTKKYNIEFNADRYSDNFYIVVKDNSIKTLNIGNNGHQCSGPIFELDKMPMDKPLPGNRKILK